MKLTIETQNLFAPRLFDFQKRLNLIKHGILDRQPDVVCFQEALFRWYDYSLVGYSTFYNTRHIINKGGLVTLIRNNLLESSHYHHHTYTKQGSLNNIFRISDWFSIKGFQAIHLPLLDIWILNTHLLANYTSTFVADESQKNQLTELLIFTEDKKSILLGDFNFDYESSFFNEINTDDKLTCLNPELKTTFDNRALDMIFVKNFKPINPSFLLIKHNQFVSNHSGVSATFLVNP